MAKSDLGTKRICPTTGKKFYDLNKTPVISPYTGEVVPTAPLPMARRAETRGVADDVDLHEDKSEDMVSLEEADAEENSGKVKVVLPESEDDIEVDDGLDDDDDDSTFIADEEEEDDDVTDIIGDVSSDEET
ncbi:MAG TPA: TIGR02300 family protein [Xanthobacteraceae bacterium]|nr:TIGR02300 family protein [Xanthobacteraceae bacterium]